MNTVLRDYDKDSGIGTITFNRPKSLNSLDAEMAASFEDAVNTLASEARLRCLVLRGSGKAFMVGGDVGSFAADLDQADLTLQRILRHMHPAILTLRALDAPIIAAVNGTAAGAGLSLVAGADLAIAKRSAKLVLAYDKLGTVPDCGGSWFLRKKIGRSKTAEMMMLGTVLNAEDAIEAQLINRVVEDDAFDEELNAFCRRVAKGPTAAFGRFKRLMDQDLALEAQLEAEKAGFMASTYTNDFRSGVCAFIDKSKADFAGN